MNAKQVGLSVLLADFSALTAYAVYQVGVVGIFEQLFANWVTTTLVVDLTIALSLVLAWMWNDSRDRGTAFFPYAVLTLAFGSVGPLLYLIRREGAVERPAPRLAAGGARA